MEGSEEAFRVAIKAHMKHGTTSIFPTLSSSTVPMIEAACETCEKLMDEENSPVLGLHLEGPYFNPKQARRTEYPNGSEGPCCPQGIRATA